MDSKVVLKGVRDYSMITVGIILYVFGWSIFLIPNNLIGGGVTGISSIIQYATHGVVKIGISYFVLNVALVIAGLAVLGRGFGWKTVYAMLIASVGLTMFQDILPAEIIKTLAIDNGKLMSTIMGAIMVGVSIGLTMSSGGSTGGTDIIALIVNKYRNVSPGRMILGMDVFIILSSLIVPSYTQSGELMPFTDKITTVVYGFIYVFIVSTVLDLYLSGSRQSVQIMVFSKKHSEIADLVNSYFHRGVTVLNGMGWYTKTQMDVLVILARKTDLSEILKGIKHVDPDAFLSVSSVTGVYGKGFDIIKTGSKK